MTLQKRILLVDNEPVITQALKMVLEENANYLVSEENNSRNAFFTARRFRPDLIFLDFMMPGFDGGDVARQIETEPSLEGTQIVFLTSLVAGDEAVSGRLFGGYRFLAKPMHAKQVLACAEELLPADEEPAHPVGQAAVFSSAARFIRRIASKA